MDPSGSEVRRDLPGESRHFDDPARRRDESATSQMPLKLVVARMAVGVRARGGLVECRKHAVGEWNVHLVVGRLALASMCGRWSVAPATGSGLSGGSDAFQCWNSAEWLT